MIKKFKNWYNNLLSFQKVRFWQVVLGIISYFLSLWIFTLHWGLEAIVLCPITLCPFASFAVASAISLLFKPDEEEMIYKLKKMYKESEDSINVWFDTACSECIKVNIKYNEDSLEILSYYNEKHLLVNSFYVERKKSALDKKTIYYIYADCEGKQDKVVFPKEITNAGYILARFTLAN